MDTNIGKWDGWYETLGSEPSAFRYADTETYQLAADFLNNCEIVEDWGVGAGGFLRYRSDAIGVDGSNTPFAAKKFVDLVTYTSRCDGVHMRHVLEHNYNWEQILINALNSSRKKVCVVLFVPPSDGDTKEIAHNAAFGVDVPDLSLSKATFNDIVRSFKPWESTVEELDTASGYKKEYVVRITR